MESVQRRKRDGVGAQKHLAAAVADGERRAAAGAHQQVLLAGEEHRKREGALQPLQRLGHGFDRLQATLKAHRYEMRHHLRVGVAGEFAAGGADFPLQRLEILDDAVVDDGDAVGGVGMRVRLGRGAVRRPAGVADAGRAGERLSLQPCFEVAELAAGAAAHQLPLLERGDAGGIVAAIFQPFQRIHDQRSDRLASENSDNPAHGRIPRSGAGLDEDRLLPEIKSNLRI